MSAAGGQKRFEIAYSGINAPLLKVLGMGGGHVIVTPDDVIIKMGWGFSGIIPRSRITAIGESDKPRGFGWGVHGWKGRWVVNGSDHGIVRIDIDPATTMRTMVFPINPHELYISLVNPKGFLEALG